MAFGGCRYRLEAEGWSQTAAHPLVWVAGLPPGCFSVVAAFAVPPHLAWGRICIAVARGETHDQPKT